MCIGLFAEFEFLTRGQIWLVSNPFIKGAVYRKYLSRNHEDYWCINVECALAKWINNQESEGGSEAVWLLCSFYHDALQTQIITDVNSFAVWNPTSLKSQAETQRRRRDLRCEYELHNLPKTKVDAAKDHGKTMLKLDLLLSTIFSAIVYRCNHRSPSDMNMCL